jgi:hypothetical protein
MILSLMVHQTPLAGFDRRAFWRIAREPINLILVKPSQAGYAFAFQQASCFALLRHGQRLPDSMHFNLGFCHPMKVRLVLLLRLRGSFLHGPGTNLPLPPEIITLNLLQTIRP